MLYRGLEDKRLVTSGEDHGRRVELTWQEPDLVVGQATCKEESIVKQKGVLGKIWDQGKHEV